MTASDFFRVARRPRWIGALLLALAIAAGFAALGQWQLSRSIENATAPENAPDTELVVPLDSIAKPQTPFTDPQIGQRVELDGQLVPGDFDVVTGRTNGGRTGAWLVGHVVTDDGPSIAVALGWAPDADAALAAEASAAELGSDWQGRYLPSESPHSSDFEAGLRTTVSVGELINLWAEAPDTVYAGYLVAQGPPAGLEQIDSPPPIRDLSLNWLNLFYAAEWVIFAGFAGYLWYRLVRDQYEHELEAETAAGEQSSDASVN